MDSAGGFLEADIDRKPYLVYLSPMYQTSLPSQHRFLCPYARVLTLINVKSIWTSPYNVEPYKKMDEGILLHFSHLHPLSFEIYKNIYDETKFCQACVLPIYEGLFYSCHECDYILHETCAEARRKIQHTLHPHPLQLDLTHVDDAFDCSACIRMSTGFVYGCSQGCNFQLDVRCGLVSEPFIYQGHEHPLFQFLSLGEKPRCHVCWLVYCNKSLNCIECEFVICFKCATLPYLARYKHDKHYLTFCDGEKASDSDWCEICEGKLAIGGEEGFYTCKDCCTTLHIHCLFGKDPYLKVGQTIKLLAQDVNNIHVHHNRSSSRPICKQCHRRCPDPIVVVFGNAKLCTYQCVFDYVLYLLSVTDSWYI